MNERERAILRGKPITPQTEDEAALKYAVENGGGGVVRVNYTTDPVACDKTPSEVIALLDNGGFCYAVNNEVHDVLYLSYWDVSSRAVSFAYVRPDASRIELYANGDDVWRFSNG